MLSPDGNTIATVTHRVGDQGISLIDVESGQAELFTLGPDAQWAPAWSPDGERIAFAQSGPGGSRVAVQEVASGGQPTELYTAARGQELWGDDWSSDGAWILVAESGPNGNDVKAMRADGSGAPVEIAAGLAQEQDPQFSPDGQWIVYAGDNDLYLVSFPNPSRRFQLGPGQSPHWSRSGREILYWQNDTLFSLPFAAGQGRGREVPVGLFALPQSRGLFDDFDVTADGERILIRLPNPDAYARGIDVVLNGFTALRTRSRNGGQ